MNAEVIFDMRVRICEKLFNPILGDIESPSEWQPHTVRDLARSARHRIFRLLGDTWRAENTADEKQ
jgi:hypothetical protein